MHNIAQAARSADAGAIHEEPAVDYVDRIAALEAEIAELRAPIVHLAGDMGGCTTRGKGTVSVTRSLDRANCIPCLRTLAASLQLQRDTARAAVCLTPLDAPVVYDGSGHAEGRGHEIHYAPKTR
jgi:hypothetical protein